jgi:hypothetical protein
MRRLTSSKEPALTSFFAAARNFTVGLFVKAAPRDLYAFPTGTAVNFSRQGDDGMLKTMFDIIHHQNTTQGSEHTRA